MAAEPGTDLAPSTPEVRPVTRRAAGDSGAVEAAWVSHHRDVFRYLLALTGSGDEADELTAEVFERALRTWTSAPEPALPWLLTVARRLATDRWRRARRLARILARRRDSQVVEGDADRAEFWAWFRAVSAILTDRQREALVLRYQRDLTDDEIGQVMGLTPSGVRSLVARALDALRAHPEVL
jgi:RNA polymerase sigma factor (sigma-70 family)